MAFLVAAAGVVDFLVGIAAIFWDEVMNALLMLRARGSAWDRWEDERGGGARSDWVWARRMRGAGHGVI